MLNQVLQNYEKWHLLILKQEMNELVALSYKIFSYIMLYNS